MFRLDLLSDHLKQCPDDTDDSDYEQPGHSDVFSGSTPSGAGSSRGTSHMVKTSGLGLSRDRGATQSLTRITKLSTSYTVMLSQKYSDY